MAKVIADEDEVRGAYEQVRDDGNNVNWLAFFCFVFWFFFFFFLVVNEFNFLFFFVGFRCYLAYNGKTIELKGTGEAYDELLEVFGGEVIERSA